MAGLSERLCLLNRDFGAFEAELAHCRLRVCRGCDKVVDVGISGARVT